jgi:hypothetical protein
MATTSCCGKALPDRSQKISCGFSLMAARLAAQQIENRRAGLAIDYTGLRCIGGPPPTPPLASLSGVKSGISFLFGSGFCVSLILIDFLLVL